MKIKQLKEKGKLLEPVIRIGKNGLTNNLIEEIKKQLKKKELIKVKMLRSFLQDKNKKAVAKDLAQKTDSTLIDLVGFTVILSKEP